MMAIKALYAAQCNSRLKDSSVVSPLMSSFLILCASLNELTEIIKV